MHCLYSKEAEILHWSMEASEPRLAWPLKGNVGLRLAMAETRSVKDGLASGDLRGHPHLFSLLFWFVRVFGVFVCLFVLFFLFFALNGWWNPAWSGLPLGSGALDQGGLPGASVVQGITF